MKSRFALAYILLPLIVAAACNHTRRFPLQGEVVAKNIDAQEITVKHGDIPGFMMAMAMPYRVNDPNVVKEVQPGDKIAADVVVGSDRSDFWLENVRITDKSGRSHPDARAVPSMLAPGQLVPNVTLVNQDGRAIHLRDFAGKALLVTFVYTRCPMPDFCPRLSRQFARIHEELKTSPEDYSRTHLLTISFDPKYDTPAVLRKYGLTYLDGNATGFAHWDFASARTADLREITKDFGLQYDDNSDQITHSTSIALIAPDSTIANYWSTDWTAEDLTNSLRKSAATRAATKR
jgi:protein SCO1/2